MKRRIFLLINTIILLTFISVNAFSQGQNTTQGREFWVSIGKNTWYSPTDAALVLQVRIVAPKATTVTFNFTNIGTTRTFSLAAGGILTYELTSAEKTAVYSDATGTTNKSLHITSTEDVTIYAINLCVNSSDATHILPVTSYGIEYYHLSYMCWSVMNLGGAGEGYTVVAIENGTTVQDNGITVATLNRGEVYTRYFGYTDQTGKKITSNKPIAYFVTNASARVLNSTEYADNLYEQMSPIRAGR